VGDFSNILKTTQIIKTKSFRIAIYLKGDAKASKLALVLPGSLDSKDYPHMRRHVDSLSKNGFLALSFDPPGTWESEGDLSIYTMTSYIKAINEIIEYYGNRPTFVVGHSRGGSMAMLAGTRISHVTHFVSIISSPTFDPKVIEQYPDPEWKARGYRLEPRDAPIGYKKGKIYKLPYSFLEDEIQYDMLEDLKTCIKPKLFIGSTDDLFTELSTTKNVFKVSADPKFLHILKTKDHDYRKHPKILNEVDRVIVNLL